MSDASGALPAQRTGAARDVDTQRTLRKLGLALLAVAVTVDVVASTRDRWKRAVALQYSKWVDDVLPEESALLDVALGLLSNSGD